MHTPIERYLLCLVFVTVFALIAKNLVRGNLGRQWMAIRDMDIAAELMGIRPLYAKLTAFAVSSFIVGVAGALWAFVYLGSWEPLAFDIDRSLQLLFMVIIGGLGSILGSFLGAAFILMLPIFLNQVPARARPARCTPIPITHLEFIIFGSLICYLLIDEPHGFARLWSIAQGEAAGSGPTPTEDAAGRQAMPEARSAVRRPRFETANGAAQTRSGQGPGSNQWRKYEMIRKITGLGSRRRFRARRSPRRLRRRTSSSSRSCPTAPAPTP